MALSIPYNRQVFLLFPASFNELGYNNHATVNNHATLVCRNSLAKTIYSRLFDHLVTRVNQSIGQVPNPAALVGVLDIYGFEAFATNDFEQFCINFANEKLQQHFNQHVFKMEQAEYEVEEIDWSYIEFVDNQVRFSFIFVF